MDWQPIEQPPDTTSHAFNEGWKAGWEAYGDLMIEQLGPDGLVWRPIDDCPPDVPVLVGRPTDKHTFTTPTSAFFDATGVWRVFRSRGGMEQLPFAPTHWMPLPKPPVAPQTRVLEQQS